MDAPVNETEDIALVRNQSETQPNECKGKRTPEPFKRSIPYRMQDRFTNHPDGTTGKNGQAHRPSDHQANQKAEKTSEGIHECMSYYHISGVLFAEDVGQNTAVLPEVDVMLREVKT